MPHSLDESLTESTPRRRRGEASQPLEVIELPNALVKLETLSIASGLSISSLYRQAKKGALPLVRINQRCTRVRSVDARAFLQSCGADA